MTRAATLVLAVSALLTLRAQSPASALGDGGPAIAAQLAYPKGIAVDNAGNIYIADSANHRIRKVTRDGVIRTVAGSGVSGPSGESSSAVQVSLSYPEGLATDTKENLYIADGNLRVYKLTPDGALHFFAGNGRRGFSGDGGPAAAASIDVVRGLAADADGNVFIVDLYNHRIRKVDPAGIISTVAGSGPDGGPTREFSGDGGPAVDARFANPEHVAIDSAGNLFFADYTPGRIRAVRRGTITTIGGNGGYSSRSGDGGPATAASISPIGIAVDSRGNVYFSSLNRIQKIAADGILSTVAGTGVAGLSGDGAAATSAQLDGPHGIALDAEGNLYIADTENCRVRRVSPSGIISTIAGSTRAPKPAGVPGGVALE